MKFEIRRTAFHGARTVSRHRTIAGAMRALKHRGRTDCCCGCAAIVPEGASRPGEGAHYSATVGRDDRRDPETGRYPRFEVEWAAIEKAEGQRV